MTTLADAWIKASKEWGIPYRSMCSYCDDPSKDGHDYRAHCRECRGLLPARYEPRHECP